MKWLNTVTQSLFISIYTFIIIFVFLIYKTTYPHFFIANGLNIKNKTTFIIDKCISITFIYMWPLFISSSMYGVKTTFKQCKKIIPFTFIMGIVYTSLYETIFNPTYLKHRTMMTFPVYLYYGIVTIYVGWEMSRYLEWKKFNVFFTIPMLGAAVCAWIYDRIIFTWIWFLNDEKNVILFRIVAHPIGNPNHIIIVFYLFIIIHHNFFSSLYNTIPNPLCVRLY